ncbi:uncharacterized protein PADG_08478 [Paracoccidioides brasiliensis Pb18]|uniref:Uncharacterized protein n=1 Tax=Paracoccidioides brasiliensis (strain Pb18) TaxID=502780 RepID=C1GMJ2_PARBD|nr:uncharacterized protein PADG_08478 [Paracoccidioides brasiliensis Pb18]EEH43658.2 hypothetical protein PADG_08478 [Paracoccidioides brasiliensis Pb18]
MTTPPGNMGGFNRDYLPTALAFNKRSVAGFALLWNRLLQDFECVVELFRSQPEVALVANELKLQPSYTTHVQDLTRVSLRVSRVKSQH